MQLCQRAWHKIFLYIQYISYREVIYRLQKHSCSEITDKGPCSVLIVEILTKFIANGRSIPWYEQVIAQ